VLERLPGGEGGAVRVQDHVLELVGDGSIDLEDDFDISGALGCGGKER
jgi:hypothetical protein